MTKKVCKKGSILRDAYITKKGVHVSEVCVKDTGMPGKGQKIIPKLESGTLHNYHYNKSDLSRHRALLQAARNSDYNAVIRKLNAISILTKNTIPKASKMYIKDMHYVQETKKKNK